MHGKVEKLTSRNLSLKIDIDKLKNEKAQTELVRKLYFIQLNLLVLAVFILSKIFFK